MSTAAIAPPPGPSEHIPWLDGLRGIAACWVLASHVQILSGMPWTPLLSWGGTAVDLFMLLSGFLMTHLALARSSRDTWHDPATWMQFWIRRFFRIAPLYYVLLLVALLIGPALGEMRSSIAAYWPATATSPSRYFDHSLANVLAHLGLVFGASPHYAFNTPLPDWSIGLEIQFYALFPLIMTLAWKFGVLRSGVALMLVCFLAHLAFPGYFAQFEMPAFLPMKLHMFLFGAWMAYGRRQSALRPKFFAALVIVAGMCLYARNLETAAGAALVIAMFYLVDDGALPGATLAKPILAQLRGIFASRLARFLGDTSYSVYLLHLLILIPLAASLAAFPDYRALAGWERFGICLVAIVPPTFLLALLLHRLIELPGIKLGASLARRFRDRGLQLAATRKQA